MFSNGLGIWKAGGYRSWGHEMGLVPALLVTLGGWGWEASFLRQTSG